MNIGTEIIGGALVARVDEGRIDAAGAIRFKDRMRELTADTAADRVILDLSQVAFIDSSGLGAIVSVMKLLAPTRRLELASLTENVAKVLRLTRMDTVFVIHAAAPARGAGHAA
jgi:anti-sigma B factor antagonist